MQDDDRLRARYRRRRLMEWYLLVVPLPPTVMFVLWRLQGSIQQALVWTSVGVVLLGSLLVPLLVSVDIAETDRDGPARWYVPAAVLLPVPVLAYYFHRTDGWPASGPVGRHASVFVWVSIPGFFALFIMDLLDIGATLAGVFLYLPGRPFLRISALGVLLMGLFPLAIYADTKYIRRNGAGWSPSPSARFMLALTVFSPLLVLQPVYAIYHLWRRRQAL